MIVVNAQDSSNKYTNWSYTIKYNSLSHNFNIICIEDTQYTTQYIIYYNEH